MLRSRCPASKRAHGARRWVGAGVTECPGHPTDSRHGQWKYRDYQPFQGKDSEVSAWTKENFYKEWAEIMDARRVFNCITVWVPFNEAWCQFDTPDAVAFTRARLSGRTAVLVTHDEADIKAFDARVLRLG